MWWGFVKNLTQFGITTTVIVHCCVGMQVAALNHKYHLVKRPWDITGSYSLQLLLVRNGNILGVLFILWDFPGEEDTGGEEREESMY